MAHTTAKTEDDVVDGTARTNGGTERGVKDEVQHAANPPSAKAEDNEDAPAVNPIDVDVRDDLIQPEELANGITDAGNQPNRAANGGGDGGVENWSDPGEGAEEDAAADAVANDGAVESHQKHHDVAANETQKVVGADGGIKNLGESGIGAEEHTGVEAIIDYDAGEPDAKRRRGLSGQRLPPKLQKKLPKYKVTVRAITALANAATWFDLHHLKMRLNEAVYSGAPHEPLRIPIGTWSCDVQRSDAVRDQIGHIAGTAAAVDAMDAMPDCGPKGTTTREPSGDTGAVAVFDVMGATPDGDPKVKGVQENVGNAAKATGTDAVRCTTSKTDPEGEDAEVDDMPKPGHDKCASVHPAALVASTEKASAQATQLIPGGDDRGALTGILFAASPAVPADANEGAFQTPGKAMNRKQRQLAVKHVTQNQNQHNRDGSATSSDSAPASPRRSQRFAFVHSHRLITLEGDPEEDANMAKKTLQSVVKRVRHEHGFFGSMSYKYPLELRLESDVEVETGLRLDVDRLQELAPGRGRDKARSHATDTKSDDLGCGMADRSRNRGVYAGKKRARGDDELDVAATEPRLVMTFRLGKPEVAVEASDDGRLLIRHISSFGAFQLVMKKIVPILLLCEPRRAQAHRKKRAERWEKVKLEREVKHNATMKAKRTEGRTGVREVFDNAPTADAEEDLVVVEDRGKMDDESDEKEIVKVGVDVKVGAEEGAEEEPKEDETLGK